MIIVRKILKLLVLILYLPVFSIFTIVVSLLYTLILLVALPVWALDKNGKTLKECIEETNNAFYMDC